jgi:MarR family transcriptional repressor of emrRAB
MFHCLFSQPDGAVHPGDTCAYGAKPPNMSRISDALVSREFITRVLSVRDRRRMVLRISERGGQPVRELLPQLFLPLRGPFAEFSQDEQRRLIDELKRLSANSADPTRI